MLRYNDYKNDNFSYNDSSLTIAARYDLTSNKCYGATDVKFISVKELLEGKFYAHIISGPTNEQQPTFSWKDTKCYKEFPDKYYHEGLVETWNFDWINYKLQFLKSRNDDDEDDDSKILNIIISIISCVILIIIIILVIILIRSKKSNDKLREDVNTISFIDNDKNNTKGETDDLLE